MASNAEVVNLATARRKRRRRAVRPRVRRRLHGEGPETLFASPREGRNRRVDVSQTANISRAASGLENRFDVTDEKTRQDPRMPRRSLAVATTNCWPSRIARGDSG